MQNTSAALTVPSFRRLPLFISTRILSYPVLLNLLLSYKTVSSLVAFAVTVTLLQLSFPSLAFQVTLFLPSKRAKNMCRASVLLKRRVCWIYHSQLFRVKHSAAFFYFFFSFPTTFLPLLSVFFSVLFSGSGRSGCFGTYFHFVF